jgi:hypothetical protein
MTTLKEAEAARDAHAESLRLQGAHAIEVSAVGKGAKKDYAVVAYFAKKPAAAQSTSLAATVGGKPVTVPLIIKVAPPFQPE